MPFDTVTKIGAALDLFLIIACLQLLLEPTLVEGFRQRIFRLRREMFLFMIEQKLDPSEPAYTHLRSTMNGLLRFAERLTVVRVLLHGAIFRQQTYAYSQKVHERLSMLQNPMLREKLSHFRLKLGYEIIRHIVITSPIAWVLCSVGFILVIPMALLLIAFRGLQELLVLSRYGIAAVSDHFSVRGIEAQAEALIIKD